MKAGRSRHWPAVEGKIVGSQMVKRPRSSGSSSGGSFYYPSVETEYHLKGRRYLTSKITWRDDLGMGSATPKHAMQVLRKYPVGRKVTVHYDPSDPGTAVLEPGRDAALPVLLLYGIFGILFLMVSALMIHEAGG